MNDEQSVREPAVAGLFYPADRDELAATVRAHLDLGSALAPAMAPTMAITSSVAKAPKAIIAPHAGYDYSGPIAGTAFAPLADASDRVRRVVLLGPAHRVRLRGLALPGAAAFATPLGEVRVDPELATRVAELPQVSVNLSAHAQEHSLEVEIPFLQLLFENITLLPLVVGDAGPEEVAEVLDTVWGGDETRLVISSDLSHYLPYDDARSADRATAEKILAFDSTLDPNAACGAFCVNGLLDAARDRGLGCELFDLRNSGDTAGDRSRVVGYGAFAFYES
ncbi:MAG: AmmeMemoRadiSam system protein B [Acidobacteria bacterium]|nr:AmmeMemoRadiSam system protein B [Acidobacteriota bacterium]